MTPKVFETFKNQTLFFRMFRNQYDSSAATWSPQGRIHQIEYAMEAVKQGSATVGVKSNTHAVLVALKRAQNDLSAHQKKCLRIAPHCGMTMAGKLSSILKIENIKIFERFDCRWTWIDKLYEN